MSQALSVESLDKIRSNLRTLVAEESRRPPKFRCCELRIQVGEEKSSFTEAGEYRKQECHLN